MLTIIIPVYKVEPYIEQCARSLMEQTLKDDVEYLFINDCTPDRSMDILKSVIKEYPERTAQITIVDNDENIGIYYTRKKALSLAKGDYVGWCDSDDWCEPDMYEKLVSASDNLTKDIVIANFICEEENGESKKNVHDVTNNPQEAIAELMQKSMFPYQLWETIMRRELLIEGFKRIRPTMSGEDCYAAMIAFYYAHSINYVRDFLYHHRILSTSLTQNILRTREEWNAQRYNIKYVERLYCGKKYSEGLMRWKIYRKKVYLPVFSSLWDYYWNFPEIEWSNPQRHDFSAVKRFLAYPVYRFFPFFWFVKRKAWNRNRQELFW